MFSMKRTITLLTVVLTSLSAAVPVAAQDLVTGAQPYGADVKFEKHEDWGPYCVWAGKERDGSFVYGWENQQQCGVGVIKWGYDLNSDGKLDAYAWSISCPGSGAPFLQWEWADDGQVTERVISVCLPGPPLMFVPSYYMSPQYEVVARNQPDRAWAFMKADCDAKLTWLDQRFDNAYRAHQQAVANANANPLAHKIAWFAYKRAWETREACRNFLKG
jgi:hypothetical protein